MNNVSCCKTNKMTYAPGEDSDQGSLIRVFAVRMKKHWALNYLHLLSALWRLIRLGGCPGWFGSSLGAHAIFSSPELKAHWWAYGIGRPPSSVWLSSTLFKHLLLRNHWANWSQISYGVSMGWGNERLFKRSWSHDQDGCHAHIW